MTVPYPAINSTSTPTNKNNLNNSSNNSRQQKSLLSFFSKPQDSLQSSLPTPSLFTIQTKWLNENDTNNSQFIEDAASSKLGDFSLQSGLSSELTPTSRGMKSLQLESSPMTPRSHLKRSQNVDENKTFPSFENSLVNAEDEIEVIKTPTKSRRTLCNSLISFNDNEEGDYENPFSMSEDHKNQKTCKEFLLQNFTYIYQEKSEANSPSFPDFSEMSFRLKNNRGYSEGKVDFGEDTLGDDNENMLDDGRNDGRPDRYAFLKSPLDANKRPPSDPLYDPTTLYIPPSSWNSFTAFEKQFWTLKSTHFSTVVFFKKGKFYELYEGDAVLGSTLFDLRVSEKFGVMKMAGVPEASFDIWAAKFIEKGYKVAQVDQLPPSTGKDSIKKKPAVMERGLTCILTASTSLDPASAMPIYLVAISAADPSSSQTLDFSTGSSSLNGKISFGIAKIDTSTSKLSVSIAKSIEEVERYLTMYRPREILYLSPMEENIRLNKNKNGCAFFALENLRKKGLTGQSDFHTEWTQVNSNSLAANIKNILNTQGINSHVKDADSELAAQFSIDFTKKLLNLKDLTAFTAVQMIINHINSLHLAKSLYPSLELITDDLIVNPNKTDDPTLVPNYYIDEASVLEDSHCDSNPALLYLDKSTISQLELLVNVYDGTPSGSLFAGYLDQTLTAPGKRHLLKWLLLPTKNERILSARYDAVDVLMAYPVLLENLRSILVDYKDTRYQNSSNNSSIDLERLFPKIVTCRLSIKDFIRVLGYLIRVCEFVSSQYIILKTNILLSSLTINIFNDALKAVLLQSLQDALKINKLMSLGHSQDEQGEDEVIPKDNDEMLDVEGSSLDVISDDSILSDLQKRRQCVKDQLNEYIEVLRKEYRSSAICLYFKDGAMHNNCLIEVPTVLSIAQKPPRGWTLVSKTKQVARFCTPALQEIVDERDLVMTEMRQYLEGACRGTLYGSFLDRLSKSTPNSKPNHHLGKQHVDQFSTSLAILDILQGFCKIQEKLRSSGKSVCRPHYHPKVNGQGEEEEILCVQGVIHPVLAFSNTGGSPVIGNSVCLKNSATQQFIPCLCSQSSTKANSTNYNPSSPFLLLTGPNMGGKSTLLRSLSLNLLLAHIGAPIPCDKIQLTLVDYIHTRLGGPKETSLQSTFYSELLDISALLLEQPMHHFSKDQHDANPRNDQSLQILNRCTSFFVVDELGRGTSSTDGHAIAYAVMNELFSGHSFDSNGKITALYRRLGVIATHDKELAKEFAQNYVVNTSNRPLTVSMVHCMHMATTSDYPIAIIDPSAQNSFLLDPSQDVTFLYTLSPGIAPSSFAFYVARQAGIPADIIQDAQAFKLTEAEKLSSTAVSTKTQGNPLSSSDHASYDQRVPLHHLYALLSVLNLSNSTASHDINEKDFYSLQCRLIRMLFS